MGFAIFALSNLFANEREKFIRMCDKGKSGGYRIVYFLDLIEKSINLDFIEERKELGFHHEAEDVKIDVALFFMLLVQ